MQPGYPLSRVWRGGWISTSRVRQENGGDDPFLVYKLVEMFISDRSALLQDVNSIMQSNIFELYWLQLCSDLNSCEALINKVDSMIDLRLTEA